MKVNIWAELLRSAGFEIVSPDQEADYYIVNSCTVTATADQKTRQSVRRFKRRHPGATVILTGCMPQAFPEEAKASWTQTLYSLTRATVIFFPSSTGIIQKKAALWTLTPTKPATPLPPAPSAALGSACAPL